MTERIIGFRAECKECDWLFKVEVPNGNYKFVNFALDNAKENRRIHRRYTGHNPGIKVFTKNGEN